MIGLELFPQSIKKQLHKSYYTVILCIHILNLFLPMHVEPKKPKCIQIAKKFSTSSPPVTVSSGKLTALLIYCLKAKPPRNIKHTLK